MVCLLRLFALDTMSRTLSFFCDSFCILILHWKASLSLHDHNLVRYPDQHDESPRMLGLGLFNASLDANAPDALSLYSSD